MVLDATYGAKLFPGSILSANGSIAFVDNVINTYMDLDALIESAGLSPAQHKVVKKLMAGWTSADIAEQANVLPQTINIHLKRAVEKIVEANEQRWELFAETALKYRMTGAKGMKVRTEMMNDESAGTGFSR